VAKDFQMKESSILAMPSSFDLFIIIEIIINL